MPEEIKRYCSKCSTLLLTSELKSLKYYNIGSLVSHLIYFCHKCYPLTVTKCHCCKKDTLRTRMTSVHYNSSSKKYLSSDDALRKANFLSKLLCLDCFKKNLWVCMGCVRHFALDVEQRIDRWEERRGRGANRRTYQLVNGPYCESCYPKCKQGIIMIRPRMPKGKFVEETKILLVRKEEKACVESQDSSRSVVKDQAKKS